ncbi:MAG: hypothetical protein ACLQPH_06110 [Acidimicrobiales bacterium]
MSELGAVVDALGTDPPDVIPGDVVRELVARKEHEVDALLRELEDARREADEAELRLSEHPAMTGAEPSRTTALPVAGPVAGPTAEPPAAAVPDDGVRGNGATGGSPASRPGTLATIQTNAATGAVVAPGEVPSAAPTPAPMSRPRTTVDTRARNPVPPAGVSPAVAPALPPRTPRHRRTSAPDDRGGRVEWFRAHLMFKAGIAFTVVALLLLKFG